MLRTLLKNSFKPMPSKGADFESKRNLSFFMQRLTNEETKKQGKPEVFQVTSDSKDGLTQLKPILDKAGIFAIKPQDKEALLVVKQKNTFSFEDVMEMLTKTMK